MDDSQAKPPHRDTAGTVARKPITVVFRPAAGDEPTVLLPMIHRTPRVEARAVIVYEPEPRRRRGLWVFTGLLVALTAGVVLGQAAAYQPAYRSLPTAQAAPVPSYVAPPVGLPSPPAPASPLPGHRITAPLGTATQRLIEVTGAGTPLRIGSADLGDLLFSVATVDGSIVPTVVDTSRGPRLTLAQAGAVAGAAGTEVQLNAKVRWTLRLTGGATEQVIDMRAGGLAGIEVTGASRMVLDLPKATGTLAFRITGAVGDLRIRTGDDVPVRLRLDQGADRVTLDSTRRRTVRSGDTVLSPGWRSATNRYDISMSARVGSVLLERAP